MSETPNLPASAPESNNVTDAVATLQLQLQAVLIILIMLSGGLNLYLYRQYSVLRKEVAAIEPQVAQMLDGYQRATVPLKDKFLSLLTNYAKTHPDFQPILDKYRVQAAPAPAAPAAPKAQPTAPTVAPAKTTAPAKSPAPATKK